MKNIKLFLQV